MTGFTLIMALLFATMLQSFASTAERVQSTQETLERLRKMTSSPARTRPSSTVVYSPQSTPGENETEGYPSTSKPSTTNSGASTESTESTESTPEPSTDDQNGYVLAPVTDQSTINLIQNVLNSYNPNNFNKPPNNQEQNIFNPNNFNKPLNNQEQNIFNPNNFNKPLNNQEQNIFNPNNLNKPLNNQEQNIFNPNNPNKPPNNHEQNIFNPNNFNKPSNNQEQNIFNPNNPNKPPNNQEQNIFNPNNPSRPPNTLAPIPPVNNQELINQLRQNGIIDRVTTFAGNFFPIVIDVPDLVGSLTSWIPGANLIGQLITGNRPNTQSYAVLRDNGQIIIVNFLKSLPNNERPLTRGPFINNFQGPFRGTSPFTNPNFPFSSPFPQVFPEDLLLRHHGFQKPSPFLQFPGVPFLNRRQEFLQPVQSQNQPDFYRGQMNNFQNFGFGSDMKRFEPNVNDQFRHPVFESLLFPRGRSLKNQS